MAKEVENNFGLLSVVFGILSIVFSLTVFIGSIAGIVFGILGLVFGIIQYRKNKNKWSKWGIGVSVAGIIIGSVIFYWLIMVLSDIASQLPNLQGGINAAPY